MGKIANIAAMLEAAVLDAEAAFAEAKRGQPDDLIRMYVRVTEEYEYLDTQRKALNAIIEGVSRNFIPEALFERKIKTISLEDIKKRVTVSTRISCSIIPEAKPDAFQWLRAPSQNAGALIQETVNAGTLSSYAKSRVEELGMEMPDNLFKMSSMQYTSVTKIK